MSLSNVSGMSAPWREMSPDRSIQPCAGRSAVTPAGPGQQTARHFRHARERPADVEGPADRPAQAGRTRSPREPARRRHQHRRAGPGSASSRTGRGSTTLARLRRVIARVPKGKVVTYGQVAEIAGFPRGARLTVRALQRAEGLPWHRVVAAGGRIALPGAEGREQRLRLEIEGVQFRGGRVRMDLHAWRVRVGSVSSELDRRVERLEFAAGFYRTC